MPLTNAERQAAYRAANLDKVRERERVWKIEYKYGSRRLHGTRCLRSKAVDARVVRCCSAKNAVISLASITITRREFFAACCATHAIGQSGCSKRALLLSRPYCCISSLRGK